MDQDRTDERTHYEASADVLYSINYHLLNLVILRRAKIGITLFSLISGATAFASVFKNSPTMLAVGGFGTAALSYLDVAIGISEKIAQHDSLRQQFAALYKEANDLPLAELDKRYRALNVGDSIGFSSLRFPAYNQAVCTLGQPSYIQPVTFFQRFMSWLA